MLQEEQAADLLNRCEKLLGLELRQLRGNLRNAGTRAAAVWELLVLEAASNIGSIEYEPLLGSSPDIRLFLPNGRSVWIEVAYLYPRFWREERKSSAVISWLYSEARLRGIPLGKIFIRLDGIDDKGAGPIRKLPELHERKKFLNDPEIKSFYDIITSNASDKYACSLSNYTVSILYNPDLQGSYSGSGGLVQEVPKTYRQHAVYRVLKAKARQHVVKGPHVICIGSDQSRVLTISHGPLETSVHEAVRAAFAENRSLSGAILVSIKTTVAIFEQPKKRARAEILINPNAIDKLRPEETTLLNELNFNRWKYHFVQEKWEIPDKVKLRRVTGTLKWGAGMTFKVEIPANIVVDALAGKTSLATAYGMNEDKPTDKGLLRVFKEGWVVKSCSLKEGNIEIGEAPKILFEFVPPPLAVFWPKSKSESET